MLNWQELGKQLQTFVDAGVQLLKRRRREEAAISFAALLFWIGSSFASWLPADLKAFLDAWSVVLIVQAVCYLFGLALLGYGGYRVWKLAHASDFPLTKDRPSVIKGPIAFTPEDGELFRKLGRENELQKLFGYVKDTQVPMIVLMGASGAGKTSLLRAGLTHILKGDDDIEYHYWEAVPTDSGERLLYTLQETWQATLSSAVKPTALTNLVNPTAELCAKKHVIVLDQFEQLRGSDPSASLVFDLLRKVAREAKPPHRIVWIIAFRREFRSDWSDFIIPEQERGFFPPELSLKLFTVPQARDVIGQIANEARLSIEQAVVDDLIAATTIDGEISPVDIGIGLLVLAELSERQGGQTITDKNYRFAGGAEGVLTQYVSRCLEICSEDDRQTVLKAMLDLRDPQTNQRIAEGKTCFQLSQSIGASERLLKLRLERLTQRDMRLLEHAPFHNDDEPRYRISHERFIPALHRLTGQFLAGVEQTKLRFERAFLDWKTHDKTHRFLLSARDYRLVRRHEAQIPWGHEEQEKKDFLARSRRQRTKQRVAWSAAAVGILVITGVSSSLMKKENLRAHLRENHYPPELLDWQQQLSTLELLDEFNLDSGPWLQSSTLEKLTMKARPFSSSLKGLPTAKTCRALEELTLDLRDSRVQSLAGLEKLTALTQLTLSLRGSWITDLSSVETIHTLQSFRVEGAGSHRLSLHTLPPKLRDLSF